MLLIASCGKTSEEKAEIAIISCNILEASPATDASQRIKEINRARQELNEEPFLGKDDEIIEAITSINSNAKVIVTETTPNDVDTCTIQWLQETTEISKTDITI